MTGSPYPPDPIADELGDLDQVDQHDTLAELIALEAAADNRRTLFNLLRQYQQIERSSEESRRWLNTVAATVQAENDRRQTALRFLDEQIARLAKPLIPEGKKSVDVPGIGRIQFRMQPEGARISDQESFLAWAKENEARDLIRTKEEVKVAEAKQYVLDCFKDTGELPPGSEYVPEDEHASHSITFGGAS